MTYVHMSERSPFLHMCTPRHAPRCYILHLGKNVWVDGLPVHRGHEIIVFRTKFRKLRSNDVCAHVGTTPFFAHVYTRACPTLLYTPSRKKSLGRPSSRASGTWNHGFSAEIPHTPFQWLMCTCRNEAVFCTCVHQGMPHAAMYSISKKKLG